MLHVVTFWWGDKYSPHYVQRLLAGLHRNLNQPFEFICAVDGDVTKKWRQLGLRPTSAVTSIWNPELLTIRGCFARLRLFDPKWQKALLFDDDDRIVCIDLDTVIVGPIDPLFDRPEPFVIMQGGNAANPCPYNGALMMLRAGAHPEVCADFCISR